MNDSQHATARRQSKSHDSKNNPPSTRSGNDVRPQRNIRDHFGPSKQNSVAHEAQNLLDSSPSKRQKLDLIHTTQARTMEPGEMYNFRSPQKIASDAGEATCSRSTGISRSPPGSPLKPSSAPRKSNGVVRPGSSTQNKALKNLIVKNLRKTPRVDPNQYYDQVWAQLDAALTAIFRNETIPYSKEELYRAVETLCRQDRASSLYKKLCIKCRDEASTRLKQPLIKTASMVIDADLVRVVVKAWSSWSDHLATIRSIFFYLDRSYLLHSISQASIEEIGITEFRTNIFSNDVLKSKILKGACDLLRDARQGQADIKSDRLFQEAVKMFRALLVYSKEFEPKLMGESGHYFSSWGKERETRNLAEYVEACQALIDREIERGRLFGLEFATIKKLELYIEDILVRDREAMLVGIEGVSSLLKQNDVGALNQLFSLLQRRRLGEKLRPAFEAFITKQGSDIVFDEQREHEMVIRLLEFKKQLDYVVEYSFQMHQGLGHTLREAFESFINKAKRSNMNWGTDNPKPGEMIAKYVDTILKGGVKAIPTPLSLAYSPKTVKKEEDPINSSEDEDVEITKQLDQVLDLFRFVHGKAVFEAFYKRDLARRLLLQRSASADAEKSMLTRLKSECGSEFTHNLEQMFKDIELAREEITSYRSLLEENHTKPDVDLNVNVLSSSAWPSYPDVALEIPINIQKAIAGFEDYYKSKHGGRKLAWKHSLAHCQLKANFPQGNKEIVVSSFQAIVLLLFNDKSPRENIPYAEIQAASNLDDDELKRTLQSLACAKYRVLAKMPRGKDVNDSDTFAVNQNFSDQKYRIKINQIQAKETKAENKETHERVVADRNYETQAAIVRIMKTRKTITHAELVSEVIIATKSRGVLDPGDIKKNIEKLIDKEYMERGDSKEGRNAYSYLA